MQRRTFFRLTAATAVVPWLPIVGCEPDEVTYGPFDADVRAREDGLVFFDGVGRSYAVDPEIAEVLSIDAQGNDLGRLAANVELGSPTAVCATHDGTRFILDRGAARVFRLGEDGRVDLVIGEAGTSEGAFMMPSDADTDAQGRLYVADTLNHRVQVLDVEGRVLAVLGTPGTGVGELNAPSGVACGRRRLFVVNSGNSRVDAFDYDGAFIGSFESPGPRFNPTGIALRGTNEILVTDTNGCGLCVYDADGVLVERRELRDASGRLAHPVSISVDPVTGAVMVGALPGRYA